MIEERLSDEKCRRLQAAEPGTMITLRRRARQTMSSRTATGTSVHLQSFEFLLFPALPRNLLFHLLLAVGKRFRIGHGRLAGCHVHELAAAESGELAFKNVANKWTGSAEKFVEAKTFGRFQYEEKAAVIAPDQCALCDVVLGTGRQDAQACNGKCRECNESSTHGNPFLLMQMSPLQQTRKAGWRGGIGADSQTR